MPEIGRPVSDSQNSLLSVQMKSNSSQKSKQKIDQENIDRAGGRKIDNRNVEKRDPNKMDQNDFLKMLSHQMQNQDPMNPTDQSRYTADMAQFAQLEQLTNLNKKIDSLTKTDEIKRKLEAASFIGKKVVTNSNTLVTTRDGQMSDVHFNLDKNVALAKVSILDNQGNLTAEIPVQNLTRGAQSIPWNGKATDGYDAPKGNYKIQVKAWDELGNAIPVSSKMAGVVEAVSFEEGAPVFTVNGGKVFLRDVEQFEINSGIENNNSLDAFTQENSGANKNKNETNIRNAYGSSSR